MTDIYEKIDKALKDIRRIQYLISQGLAKPEEKAEAVRIAKETAMLFTDDILKRKAEKQGKICFLTMETRDGFVSKDEAKQLNGWVELLEEYKEKRKIKSKLSNEKINIASVVDGEDQHIFITEKGTEDHAHLIFDGGTGEIRVDPKDKPPHDLILSVEAKLKLKTGDVVRVTKSALSFVESEGPQPDVRAYTATKDGYPVLEIYNSGDEDLENFKVTANWSQPLPEGKQERVLEKFNIETDYLVMALPRSLNSLKKQERVYSHIPSTSIDKKIRIIISCKGIRSGNEIERVFDLETQNAYP